MMSDGIRVVPAGGSATQRLSAGQLIKVINTSGTQVIDCWAFTPADTREFMSMEHTRVEIERVSPRGPALHKPAAADPHPGAGHLSRRA
jgi:uncharacterized protein YcgI (DUF1989 family)